jgi:hypothetical protein
VGITLRVTYIRIPPLAQSGAHEVCRILEESLRVDVEGKNSYEGRYLKDKETKLRNKETLDYDFLYSSRILTDLSRHGLVYKGQERIC